MTPVIQFDNVSFSYAEKTALREISLSVKRCEFLIVLGETGSGKTTLCRLINGIVPHSSGGRLLGSVTVCGEDTKNVKVPHLAMNVAMTLEDSDAQLFTSSVRLEAAFALENLLLPAEEIEKRVKLALSAVNLGGFEDRLPSTLSGGEKQRLAIAAALAMPGKILVLDEPLARLDPKGAEEVLAVLEDLRKKHRITIVLASCSLNKAAEFADRICILKGGQITACDSAEKILANTKLLEESGIEPPNTCDINAVFAVKEKDFLQGHKGHEKKETREDIAAIDVKNFCFSYPQSGTNKNSSGFIQNINITINNNDFVAIIGTNGCGKSTLLKNITGLLHPCSGDIFVKGKNTKNLSVTDISKEIGFVMQNPDSQLFTDSVYNEISFALKNLKLSEDEIQRRVNDAMQTVGLKNPNAFPHALSRADRTKTVIACVLAMGCKIVLFDEADTGHDYKGRTIIMEIAKSLYLKSYTVIFVTHNISLACKYARRLIKMDKNGIIFDRRVF